jgi:hypothetical protein
MFGLWKGYKEPANTVPKSDVPSWAESTCRAAVRPRRKLPHSDGRHAGRHRERAWLHFLRPNALLKLDVTLSLRESPEQLVHDLLRRTNGSWRVDETYLRIAGKWTYLLSRGRFHRSHDRLPSPVEEGCACS